MHEAFGVDDYHLGDFAVGARDPLPDRILQDPLGTFRAFFAVHVASVRAQPTSAMRTAAKLYQNEQLGLVLTDNVDNLLAKTGIPFLRTRGSGVLNEFYPVTFKSPRLIVVGVAADRRSIVSQARRQGCSVVVVNPCLQVAPRVRHLNYLRKRDKFFRITADEFFRALAAEPALGLAARRMELERGVA